MQETIQEIVSVGQATSKTVVINVRNAQITFVKFAVQLLHVPHV